jgi:hypothetical protein
MTNNELDAVYTRLCNTMGEIGEKEAMLFLCRFALLCVVREQNPAVMERLISEASEGMFPESGST